MDLVENFRPVETSLKCNASVYLSFLEHLGSDFDKIEGLGLQRVSRQTWTYDGVGHECHCVGSKEPLFVHPLVPVSPVLDCKHTG